MAPKYTFSSLHHLFSSPHHLFSSPHHLFSSPHQLFSSLHQLFSSWRHSDGPWSLDNASSSGPRIFSALHSGHSRRERRKAQNERGCGEEKKWIGLVFCNRLCSIPIPLAGRHGDTQTNKPLNHEDYGLSKLLSRGVT